MRDFDAFARRVLAARLDARNTGVPYVGPSLYDAMDPVWHEIERLDHPSHVRVCEGCADIVRRQREQRARQVA